jgi:gamma-glutamyltranspeptidase
MRFSTILPSSLLLLSGTTLAVPTEAPCPPNPLLDPNQDRLGAVASESAECTQIGIDTLASGGNAAG